MRKFKSYDEYERWADSFEDSWKMKKLPVVIDDGWQISLDMFTECKSYKTALRRFEKTFREVNERVPLWAETMREICEKGCFRDEWNRDWMTKDEIKECAKKGTYSWKVQEIYEGCWYIYLIISGKYANRLAD